jgi:hypothetical protein
MTLVVCVDMPVQQDSRDLCTYTTKYVDHTHSPILKEANALSNRDMHPFASCDGHVRFASSNFS